MSAEPIRVLILNTNQDTVELLRMALEHEDYVVISAYVDDVKRGETDLGPILRQHRPACVVYDVALPYDVQWRFMEHLRKSPDLEKVPFILTTTNERRLRELVSTNAEVFEIVGKPYDLAEIVRAVDAAVGRGARGRDASEATGRAH